MELQYEIALRDEVIAEQRKVMDNLWTVLKATGKAPLPIIYIYIERERERERKAL